MNRASEQRSRAPRGWTAILLTLCAAAELTACSPAPESAEFPITAMAVRRAAHDKEWRDARSFTVLEPLTMDTGAVASPGVFRLGVKYESAQDERGEVVLRAGEQVLGVCETRLGQGWGDFRIPIPEGVPAVPLELDIQLPGRYSIGPVELAPADRPKATNVVWILIDTLRQDHVGCYGYERATTPHLDALRQDAVMFTHLVPQSSWTKPSIASMFASVYPAVHGAEDGPSVVREGLPSVAAQLNVAGYETRGISSNINVQPNYNYGTEFAGWIDNDSTSKGIADDKLIFDRALDMLWFVQGRPWMLYIHAMGPHAPYTPPAPYDTQFADPAGGERSEMEQAIVLYDGEIAHTDAQVGRFIAELKSLGIYDETLIIVTSDHGEEFGEHGGKEHGHTLYEELLRVPLLIKMPGNAFAGETRTTTIEGVDLAPTILEIVGAEPDPRFVGKSFVDVIEGRSTENRIGYASLKAYKHSMRAAVRGNEKYVHNLVARREMAFDLAADPGENAPIDPLPEFAGPLRDRTVRVGSQGAAGLHILMTFGDEDRSVAGRIEAADTTGFEVRGGAPESVWNTEAPGVVTFNVLPTPAVLEGNRWHGGLAEQRHLELFLPTNGNTSYRLSLTPSPETAPERVIHVGEAAAKMPLNGSALSIADLAAHPDRFDPAALPYGFGIYVWHVVEADSIDPSTLDEESRKALETLGYLE